MTPVFVVYTVSEWGDSVDVELVTTSECEARKLYEALDAIKKPGFCAYIHAGGLSNG